MKKDIAIIGMAGKFPDADTIDELLENLKKGKNSVGEISRDRIKNTALDGNTTYKKYGYLEDIDKFDYEFFNIAYAEAVCMSPSQRESLQIAYKTIENAGYNPQELEGKDVSIFICGHWFPDYVHHADDLSTLIDVGNAPEFLGSKVARELNLLGNCVLVNTACSSSIASMHMAINEITVGDCELALVIAGNLELFPSVGFESETSSKTGKSTAFSDNADGMVYGEAFCGVLLKEVDKAKGDRDNIHAVVTGWASNNNGKRSSSILATDSKQQCEVYLKAWKKAGITPQEIGFIEAHGSATQLGDCLEIEGLNAAFDHYGDTKQPVPISSIKSNIGHSLAAAGLAGVIKAILSLNNELIFPNVNFGKLNTTIDFEKASVYVNQILKPWKKDENKLRMAGVSSFGRGGTNSHLVLQEYHSDEISLPVKHQTDFIFTVSGKDEESLKRNVIELEKFLNEHDYLSLADVSFTLNIGRPHFDHRVAIVSNAKSRLCEELRKVNSLKIKRVMPSKATYFVFGDQRINESVFSYFVTKYKVFKEASDEFCNCDLSSPKIRSFVFQYSYYKLLLSFGIKCKNLISKGIGGIVKEYVLGGLKRGEAIQKLVDFRESESPELENKIYRFLNQEAKDKISVINMGFRDEISDAIASAQNDNAKNLYLQETNQDGVDLFLNFLSSLYVTDECINFSGLEGHFVGNRCELPTYQFNKTRCWLRDHPKAGNNADFEQVAQAKVLIESGSDIENQVAEFFARTLKLSSISKDTDFFSVGGDSIKATKLISRINDEFQIKLDFDDIFDFPTIKELADYIESQITEEMTITKLWKAALLVDEEIVSTDNFFDLGGHSILASKIINSLNLRYSIDLNFDELFFNPTVEKLAELVRLKKRMNKQSQGKTKIPSYEEQDYYSVSLAQKRMIYTQKIYKSGISYNATNVFELIGKLDVKHLKETFEILMQRHEILRTSFHFIGQTPFQKVNENVTLGFFQKDLRGKFNSKTALDKLVQNEITSFVESFDISVAPLFRIALLTVSEKKSILILDIDHTITDYTSYQLFTREFLQLFRKEELEKLEIHYKDFTIWQNQYFNSDQFGEKSTYWLRQFSNIPADLNLPTDYPRSTHTGHKGGEHFVTVDKGLSKQLMQLAKTLGVTPYILMLAGFKMLLFKLTKQEDICIGIPYAQRDNKQLESMLGVLLNTLVLRSFPKPNKDFRSFLEEVKETAINAYANSDYPFEMLLEELQYQRKPGRNPLFDVLFNSITADKSMTKTMLDEDDEELQFIPQDLKETSSTFDIYIMMQVVDSNIYLTTTYKTDLFEKSTINYFMDEYSSLLRQIVANQSLKLSDYALFDARRTKSKKIQVINSR